MKHIKIVTLSDIILLNYVCYFLSVPSTQGNTVPITEHIWYLNPSLQKQSMLNTIKHTTQGMINGAGATSFYLLSFIVNKKIMYTVRNSVVMIKRFIHSMFMMLYSGI